MLRLESGEVVTRLGTSYQHYNGVGLEDDHMNQINILDLKKSVAQVKSKNIEELAYKREKVKYLTMIY